MHRRWHARNLGEHGESVDVLTVLTWLWHQEGGRTKFSADQVNIWADMVARNLSLPHRIACVTDMPQGIAPHIDIIKPPGDFEGLQTSRWRGGRPSCFRRLAMFRRDAADIFGERFVSMDLDCVIGGPLDPLFSRKQDLVLFRGTAPERPYNGSMVMLKAGARPKVYEKFTPDNAEAASRFFVGSDQSWLSFILGSKEATWGEEDGALFWGGRYRTLRREGVKPRVLFFPGKLKPWNIVGLKVDSYLDNNYRLDMQREAA